MTEFVAAALASLLARVLFLAVESYGPDIAERLVLAWADFYTRGVPEETREDRLDSLRSDLWEHRDAGRAAGLKPEAVGFQMLYRLLAGAPADLQWRIETQPITRVDVLRIARPIVTHLLAGPRPRGMKVMFAAVPVSLLVMVFVTLTSSAAATALAPWATLLMVAGFYGGFLFMLWDTFVWLIGFRAAILRKSP
jgi:hypothetical protein